MLPVKDTEHPSEQSSGAQGTAGNSSYGSAADPSSHQAHHHHHELLEPVPAFVETLPSRRSTISTPVTQAASNPPIGTARGRGRARSYAVTDFPTDVVSNFLLDQHLASVLSPACEPPSSITGHNLPVPVNQELPSEQSSSHGFTLNLSPVSPEVLTAGGSLSLPASSDHQLSPTAFSSTHTESALLTKTPSAYSTPSPYPNASFTDNYQLSELEASLADTTTASIEEPTFPRNSPAARTEESFDRTPQPSPSFLRRASSVLFTSQTTKTDTASAQFSSSDTGHFLSQPNALFINLTDTEGPAGLEQSDRPPPLVLDSSGTLSPSSFSAQTSHSRSNSQELLRAIRAVHAHKRTDSQETVRSFKRSDSQETIRPTPPIATPKMPGKAQTGLQEATGTKLPVRLVCPPWDRRVDISWSRGKAINWSGVTELTAFRTSVAMAVRASGAPPAANELANPLCGLPDKIRYMICKYLVPESDKPIRLNTGKTLYKAVWPDAAFGSLEGVLADLDDYMNVCRAMRTDVLMTLLNTRRFHVVVSPVGMAMLDPIGHSWFSMYAGYMQFLTIEVDFARLGFAKEPGAALLDPLMARFESRLVAYGEAQRARAMFQQYELDKAGFFALDPTAGTNLAGVRQSCSSTVHDLTVAVRRYFGNRPEDAGRGVPQKYSHDRYLSVLEPLGRALGGKVDHLRVVGTSIPAANDLIASVRNVEDHGVASDTVRLGGPSLYPSLPGQASVLVDAGDREYYFRHPGAFLGTRDFLLDEAFVRGQLEVGNLEAAGPGDKGKEKEDKHDEAGKEGKGEEEENRPLGTVPDVPERYDQSSLLVEMEKVASTINSAAAAGPGEGGVADEEEGFKEKGKGKIRVVTGKLQRKVSKLVLGGGAPKDSDGKE